MIYLPSLSSKKKYAATMRATTANAVITAFISHLHFPIQYSAKHCQL